MAKHAVPGVFPDARIGSLISLTSKRDIQYEGTLVYSQQSTIVLKDVRSLGRKGNGIDTLDIKASDAVYEYVSFRDTDVKTVNIKPVKRADDNAKLVSAMVGHPYLDSMKSIYTSSFCHDGVHGSNTPMIGGLMLPSTIWQDHANYHTSWCSLACPINVSTMISIPAQQPAAWGYPVQPFLPAVVHPENEVLASCSTRYGPSIFHAQGLGFVCTQLQTASLHELNDGQQDIYYQLSPDVPGKSSRLGNSKALQISLAAPGKPNHTSVPETLKPNVQPLLPLPAPDIQKKRVDIKNNSSARAQGTQSGRGRKMESRRRNGIENRSETTWPKLKHPDDFDFEAMNEHFNKKEIWKELESRKQITTSNAGDDKATSVDVQKQPLYAENFFDYLSSHGMDSGNQKLGFSQQLKIDIETFGRFPLSSYSSNSNRGAKRGSQCRHRMEGQEGYNTCEAASDGSSQQE